MKLPNGKVIITASVNGAFVTKKMNPNLPEQPDEIAQAVVDCYNSGAAIVHIHARDENGLPTGSVEKFEEIKNKIRQKCDGIIIQFSTGGGANIPIEERVKCLDSLPEMASLNMGTLMRQSGDYAGVPFSNMTKDIEIWAQRMTDLEIKPEMECYTQSMFRDVRNLIVKKIIKPPYYCNFVLGMSYQGALEASPEALSSMYNFLPEDTYFNVTATSRDQLPITTMGMIMGGAVRIGLEDNIYYTKGVLALSSAQLIERTVRIAADLNIAPMSSDEVRKLLNIRKR